jgi:hypothetical protein
LSFALIYYRYEYSAVVALHASYYVLFGRYRSLVLLRFAAHNTNRCAHSIACTFALLTMCSFAALILYWCSLAHYIVALCVRSLVVHVSSLRSSMSCLVTSLLDCVYLAIAIIFVSCLVCTRLILICSLLLSCCALPCLFALSCSIHRDVNGPKGPNVVPMMDL